MTNDVQKKVKFDEIAKILSCNKSAPSCSIDKQKQEMKATNFDRNPSESVINQRLLENSVIMESIDLRNFYLVGTVLVNNKDFNKSVRIRYTLDKWNSFQDLTAGYIESISPEVDLFQFKIDLLQKYYNFKVRFQDDLKIICSSMSLAVLFKVGEEEFWDSNDGKNYNIEYEYGFKVTTSPAQQRLSPRSILVKKYGEPLLSDVTQSRENNTCSTEYNRMFIGVDVLLPSFF
jgi:hypothetical protein